MLLLCVIACPCRWPLPSRSVSSWKVSFQDWLGNLLPSPEPALGGVTCSSGQGVLPCGPFPLPQTYMMISDGVLGKKCIFFPQMICYIVMGLPVHLIISYYYASTAQGPFECCLDATLGLKTCSSWVLVGWSHGSGVTPAFQLRWLSPFSWSNSKCKNICAWLRSRMDPFAEGAQQPIAGWGAWHSHVRSSRQIRGLWGWDKALDL